MCSYVSHLWLQWRINHKQQGRNFEGHACLGARAAYIHTQRPFLTLAASGAGTQQCGGELFSSSGRHFVHIICIPNKWRSVTRITPLVFNVLCGQRGDAKVRSASSGVNYTNCSAHTALESSDSLCARSSRYRNYHNREQQPAFWCVCARPDIFVNK